MLFKISFCFRLNFSECHGEENYWMTNAHGFSTCLEEGGGVQGTTDWAELCGDQTPSSVEIMGDF